MSIIKWGSSPQDCGANSAMSLKKLVCILSALVSTTLVILLVIHFILRPSNPEFFLQDASVGNLALIPSSPPLLNSSFQVSVLFSNPNPRVGVHFASMGAYATFMQQRITGDTTLRSFYLVRKGGSLQSALLSGAEMPVALSVANEVLRGQSTPWSQLSFAVEGKMRWRLGCWTTGWQRFDVDCPALVTLQPGSAGLGGRPPQCSVSL